MEEIFKRLEQFDKPRGWDTYNQATNEKEKLNFLYPQIVNLLGEFGEFANLVKKCKRDGIWEEEKLKEEVADMFIFLIKIGRIIDMDIKKECLKKLDINEERFKGHIKENNKKI